MNDIGKIIKMIWRVHSFHKQCMMHLLASNGIHFGQPPLLMALKTQGGTGNQKDLAKALNVSPASITISLKRLEKVGLVRRIPDPKDMRSNRIELTEKGLQSSKKAHDVLFNVTSHLFTDFSPEEVKQFDSYCERMKNNLQSYKKELDEREESH